LCAGALIGIGFEGYFLHGVEIRIEFARGDLIDGLGLEIFKEDFPSDEIRRFSTPPIGRFGLTYDDQSQSVEIGLRIVQGQSVQKKWDEFSLLRLTLKMAAMALFFGEKESKLMAAVWRTLAS